MILPRFISLLLISAMAGLAACGEHDHSHEHDNDYAHTHDEYHRLTHWVDGLELFVRFELHENSGRMEGELFVSDHHQPAEELTGEVQLLENGTTADSQDLISNVDGVFPFELFFSDSDEARLNVTFELNGEQFDINLGAVDRNQGIVQEPDTEDLTELDKQMQWRLSLESGISDLRNIPEIVSGFGKVLHDPGYYQEITSPVDGHIDSEDVDIVPASGTRVTSGERLLTVSPSLSSDNSWLDYQIAYRQAKEAYERAQRLIENDAISLPEYQQREREYKVRKEGIEHFTGGNRHGVQIQNEGSQLFLIAAHSGVVAETFITSGRDIQQGDPLLTLFDPSRLWIEVLAYRDELQQLPDITGAEILTGRNERVTLNNSQIRLVSRDLRSDPSGNRSKIILAVDNSDGMLSLNQPVRVNLKGDEEYSVVAVPNEAIFDNESYKVVFVVHSGDQFERRMVQTGTSYGGFTAITSGLEAGERIVTKGVYPLHLMTGNVQIDDDHDH